ncbi:MAG: hypothetical protein AAF321_05405 [Pseudomonadota bacterium]
MDGPGQSGGRRGGWSLLARGRGARTAAPRRGLWIALGALFVFGTLAAITLSALPLTSDDLTARLRQEIATRMPPELGLTLDRASLAFSSHGLVVDIDGVALSDTSAAIASIENLEVTLDPLALIGQRIEPRQLIFERPRFVLPEQTEERTLDLRGETLAQSLDQALRALARLEGGLGDADIVITDAVIETAQGTRFEGVQVVARREDLSGRIEVEASDATRRAAISIEGHGQTRRYRVDVALTDETIGFGRRQPKTIVLDEAVLRFDVTSDEEGVRGEGLIRLIGTGPDERDFRIAVPCALRDAECAVEGGELTYGGSGGALAGAFGFAGGLKGAPRFALRGTDVVLAEADGMEPVADARLDVVGAILTDRPGLTLDIATLTQADAMAELSGLIAFADRSPELDLTLKTTELDGVLAKHVWPRFLATRTRGWVIDHIFEGRVGPIDARIDVAANAIDDTNEGIPLPDGAISISAPFTDASFDYVQGLPHITQARGTVSMETQTVVITLDEGLGRLNDASGGVLDGAVFTIEDVRAQPVFGNLDATFAMTSDEVYALRGPLTGTIAALPEGMTGEATADLTLRLPLGNDISRDDVFYDLAAQVADGSVPDIYDGRPLEATAIALRANPAGFDVGGTGALEGLPVAFSLFGSPDAGVEAISASINADVAAFRALDIDLTDYVAGPVSVRLAGTDPSAGVERATVDFTGASVTLPARGVIKPEGAPASLVGVVTPTESGLSLGRLEVDATTFRARGSLDVSAAGDIDLRLSDYTIGVPSPSSRGVTAPASP